MIVMMVVMLTVIIMMMVPVPMVVGFTVALVCFTIMASIISATLHGLFKILGTVRMIVILAEGPLVEQRIALVNTRKGTIRVLYRGAPGIVVEVVEQLGVGTPQRDTAEF